MRDSAKRNFFFPRPRRRAPKKRYGLSPSKIPVRTGGGCDQSDSPDRADRGVNLSEPEELNSPPQERTPEAHEPAAPDEPTRDRNKDKRSESPARPRPAKKSLCPETMKEMTMQPQQWSTPGAEHPAVETSMGANKPWDSENPPSQRPNPGTSVSMGIHAASGTEGEEVAGRPGTEGEEILGSTISLSPDETPSDSPPHNTPQYGTVAPWSEAAPEIEEKKGSECNLLKCEARNV